MASIVWRRKSRKVYVYYNDPKSNKLKQVARKFTKHLDGQPPEVAEAWRDRWEREHGVVRDRVARSTLKKGDKLFALWEQYQEFKASDADHGQGRRQRTIEAETGLFHNHIVFFFVTMHERKDPSTWHEFIPEFHLYLKKTKLSSASRRAILWTLKRFGESLVFSRYMTFPFAIRPPRSKVEKITPLKVEKTPKEIIAFAKSTTFSSTKQRITEANPFGNRGDINFNLAILLGYFGGFGPGELFALEKADFLTGNYARSRCKTYTGFAEHKFDEAHEGFTDQKLGSTLSVIVNKTLPHVGEPVHLMKNDYRFGVSNIWSLEAATLIGEMVRARPAGRLFPFSYAYLVRRWREQVLPKLKATPHDLRRASGLYLGRELRIKLTLLQDHMRHAEIETSMLYCRRPETHGKSENGNQDFDKIAS